MTTTPPDEDTIHGRLFADLLQLSAPVFTTAKTYATPDSEEQLYIPSTRRAIPPSKGSPMHAPAMTVTLDSLEVGEVMPHA